VPHIQWLPWAPSLGLKLPGREADHSPPSSAEVKKLVGLYLHYPNTPSWRGAQSNQKGTVTIYFYLNFYSFTNNYVIRLDLTAHKLFLLHFVILVIHIHTVISFIQMAEKATLPHINMALW
jgi:hypothetical protein